MHIVELERNKAGLSAPNTLQNEPGREKRLPVTIGFIVLALIGFLFASLHSDALFRLLLETSSMAFGFSMFMVTCISSRFIGGSFLSILGYGHLFVGALDLTHAIVAGNIGVFDPGTISIQLRLSARTFQAAMLLIACTRIGKTTRGSVAFFAFLGCFTLIITSIFALKDFPPIYRDWIGATGFLRSFEYLLIAAFFCSGLLLFLKRRRLDALVFRFLFASALLSTCSEILITFTPPFEWLSRIGHYMKLLAYLHIFNAIVETGIHKPYRIVFRDLKQELAERVQARVEIENVAKFPEADPGPVFRVSTTGDILYLNRSAQDMLASMGRKPESGFPDYMTGHCRDALYYGERRTIEVPIGIAGAVYLLDIVPVEDEQYVNVYARDVSLRVAAESELRKSEARLRIATTQGKLGIFEWDGIRNRFIWENGRMYEIFGVDPKEKNLDWEAFLARIVHPDDAAGLRKAMNAFGEPNARVRTTCRIRRLSDGELRWVTIAGSYHPDRNGESIQFIGVVSDVTEQIRVEERLRTDEVRFEIASKLVGLIMAEVDSSDRFVWGSDPKPEAAMKAPGSRSIPPEIASRIEPFRRQALSTGEPVHGEVSCVLPGGQSWYDLTIEPRKNADGTVGSLVIAAFDITERKKLEDDILLAREAAEQASRAKSEFLASMSHELRTPISGILGMMELLRSRIRGREEREYIELARKSANSLLSIIGEILDISRIESGREEIIPVECELTEELSRMAAMFELSAIERGLSLRLSVQPDVPKLVRTDWEKLAQILRNLLTNALKYTDGGEVVVSARKISSSDRIAVVEFSVRDTGIGIPHDKLPFLFQNFSRVHSPALQASSEGAGLGLAIARHLVELLGGSIVVESEPGKGSTFSFTVELELQSGKTAPSSPDQKRLQAGIQPLDILVAEDDRINQIFISTALEREGHHVTIAGNGHEAVRETELTLRNGRPFDLILMDIQMPSMNGIEACSEIRKLGEEGKRIPIVALTAFALKGDRERFLSAGMDDFITKPIDMERLSELLLKIRNTSR